MPHRQDILGGVNGELAATLSLSKFKIGDVAYLRGDIMERTLTVVGTIHRDDHEECAVVTWFDNDNRTVQTAIPVAALIKID